MVYTLATAIGILRLGISRANRRVAFVRGSPDRMRIHFGLDVINSVNQLEQALAGEARCLE